MLRCWATADLSICVDAVGYIENTDTSICGSGTLLSYKMPAVPEAPIAYYSRTEFMYKREERTMHKLAVNSRE